MTVEEFEKRKRESYKTLTDDIHMLYECFVESGFTEDQAFELSNTYVRQTLFDNILRQTIDDRRSRGTKRDIRKRVENLIRDAEKEKDANDQT